RIGAPTPASEFLTSVRNRHKLVGSTEFQVLQAPPGKVYNTPAGCGYDLEVAWRRWGRLNIQLESWAGGVATVADGDRDIRDTTLVGQRCKPHGAIAAAAAEDDV